MSASTVSKQDIVITGVGVVSSIGIGQQAYFDALLNMRSGIRSLSERTDGDATPAADQQVDGVWIGGPIVDFAAKQYVKPRKALKVMCREIQTAFASAQLAIEHAGLEDRIPAGEASPLSPHRVGAVYGSEIFFNPPAELAAPIRACIDSQGQLHPEQFGEAARREIMPLWMLKYLPNMPACQIGISINSRGPNNSLVVGDVSGPAAMIESYTYLTRGIVDVMLTGATGTRIGAMRMAYHGDRPIPERGSYAIDDVSRPHADDALGTVGGEGAASLVLETAEHAAGRSAKPLARILATATRFIPTEAMKVGVRPADETSRPSRDASAAIAAAIDAALRQSGLLAGDIGLVVSHASGDRQTDAGEAAALQRCGIDGPVLAVSASLGHCGAASGMLELAAGVMALEHRMIPPTRNASSANEVRLLTKPQALTSPVVLCVSYTTDGNAVAVLLGK